MKKKGQLTVFIIIGILLLLIIGIFLYITREKATAPLDAERIQILKAPEAVQPIQEFVQQCLYITAKQGLQRLGERGAYIDPKQRYNPYEHTAGEAIQFAPNSEVKVPYWWHLSSKNNCVGDCEFASERPSLESVETQMDTYIKQELPKCLKDFEQFKEYNVRETSELEPETRITKGNVIIFLKYDLEASQAGDTYTIEEYAAELPIKFHRIYSLATNITNLQSEHAFLERATRALIDIFGRTSENALPPVSDMEFGFGQGTIWTKFDVEEKIKQLLTSYIPLLKVTYTKNYQYLAAPAGKDREMYEVMYNRGFTVPVLEPHRDMEVRFVYLPWWKPYFDMNCNGQLCQPEGFSSTLGFLFGVRRYNFAYDVSYPVLVEIKNPEAYGGEGYTFRFFLEANMRNNKPLSTLEPQLEVIDAEEQSTLFCDTEQRTSGNITLNVKTSAGRLVDGAEIIYRCGFESCSMGTSVEGKLETKFPRCLGGFVTANHIDYAPAVLPVDIIDDSEQTINLELAQEYEVDFEVVKWLLKKQSTTFEEEINGVSTVRTRFTQNWDLDTERTVNQGPRESTIILLQRKGSDFEEQITVLGDVCGSQVSKAEIPCGKPPSDNSKDIRIYPGDYHVTIYSFKYPSPDLTIPPDKRCYSYKSSSGKRKRKCYWVPTKPIIFSTEKPLFSGYAEYDWSVTDSQLANTNTIEFSYINFALDKVKPASQRKIEDLEIMGNLMSYSEQYKNLLEPNLK